MKNTTVSMNFDLADIASFITYNDSVNREGYGIPEFNDLVGEVIEKAGIDEKEPGWADSWRAIASALSSSFEMGMQAGAQLQVQLLTGGGSHA